MLVPGSLIVEVRSTSSHRSLSFTKDFHFGIPMVQTSEGEWAPVHLYDEKTEAALESIMRDHPIMREWVE